MELDLEADGEAVLEDPFGELAGVEALMDGEHQEGAALVEVAIPDQLSGPAVVVTVGDDELDLVASAEVGEVGVEVAPLFAGGGGLEVHDANHPGVDLGDVQRAAGL